MVELGVNIDHVATLRQARRTYEPDPVWAAAEAELGGADGITIHLREDRRHVNDRDVQALRQAVHCKLNLEMSLFPEIVEIAIATRPDQTTIVPERRQEVTTEGGIDLTGDNAATDTVNRLKAQGVFVSAFIDPDEKQVQAAARQGFDAIELHTGDYANAFNLHPRGLNDKAKHELERLRAAADLAAKLNLRLHAGHGLNYLNVLPVASLPGMRELNIGHAILSRAVFTGLRQAVREMKDLLSNAEG
jgi:pyridoxine 5-phosphate synthase